MKKLNINKQNWVLLIIISLIWGSSFILIKKGLESFSFDQVATLRIFIASSFLSIFGFKYFFKIPRNKILPLFLNGLLGNGIPSFLFSKSEMYIDSGVVGILNVLTPLFTVLIGVLFFKVLVKPINYIGIVLGLIGVIILISPNKFQLDLNNLKYISFAILGTILYGLSTNIIKEYLSDLNILQIATISFFTIGPISGVYLFNTDFIYIMKNDINAINSFLFVSILAIFGSALSILAFNKLVINSGPVFATSCTYFIPIVAMIWGLIDNEKISLHHILGLVIILLGVYLVNKKR